MLRMCVYTNGVWVKQCGQCITIAQADMQCGLLCQHAADMLFWLKQSSSMQCRRYDCVSKRLAYYGHAYNESSNRS